MTLIKLLEMVSESTNLCVSINGEIKAVYDGRNSIPEKYNKREIVPHGIRVIANTMFVEIEED